MPATQAASLLGGGKSRLSSHPHQHRWQPWPCGGGRKGGFAWHTCCCHLGSEQAVSSSLTKGLPHDHLLGSCLVSLSSMPPLLRRFPGYDFSLTKGSGTSWHPLPPSPRNYLRPWVYLWMFYCSTWWHQGPDKRRHLSRPAACPRSPQFLSQGPRCPAPRTAKELHTHPAPRDLSPGHHPVNRKRGPRGPCMSGEETAKRKPRGQSWHFLFMAAATVLPTSGI